MTWTPDAVESMIKSLMIHAAMVFIVSYVILAFAVAVLSDDEKKNK